MDTVFLLFGSVVFRPEDRLNTAEGEQSSRSSLWSAVNFASLVEYTSYIPLDQSLLCGTKCPNGALSTSEAKLTAD